MKQVDNKVEFQVYTMNVTVIFSEHWLEFNIKFKSGNWIRRFLGRSRYSGNQLDLIAHAVNFAKEHYEYLKRQKEKGA